MAISTIALIVAMIEEAQPLVEALALSPMPSAFERHMPMRAYENSIDGSRVVLVCNGRARGGAGISNIGTQPATLTAHLAIEHFKPDLLVSAGVAGGFQAQGAEVGDVYLSNGVFRYHDRIIPLPGYEEYSAGEYPSFDVSRIAIDLGFKIGTVSTGNSLPLLPSDAPSIETHLPAIKEMEAAAIAWVASLSSTPMFALKTVSDLVDDGAPTHEQFAQHFKLAVDSLAHATERIIKYCHGARLDDLSIGK